MDCKDCRGPMTGLSVYDSPKDGYAFNLYQCDGCGILCKQDVWKHAGLTWLDLDNNLTREPKE